MDKSSRVGLYNRMAVALARGNVRVGCGNHCDNRSSLVVAVATLPSVANAQSIPDWDRDMSAKENTTRGETQCRAKPALSSFHFGSCGTGCASAFHDATSTYITLAGPLAPEN